MGLGGGCDIISAYATQFLFEFHPDAQIMYANTKRAFDGDLKCLTENIARLPPQVMDLNDEIPIEVKIMIDRCIPRGDGGCPYIIKCTNDSVKSLPHEIQSLGFDLVLGVDAGGDAIIEGALSGRKGRDKMMVSALFNLEIPFLVLILGPGCDGESFQDQIQSTFLDLKQQGRYHGFFSLALAIPHFEQMCKTLGETRTPNIIKNTYNHRYEDINAKGRVLIPRGLGTYISKELLIHGFAFGY